MFHRCWYGLTNVSTPSLCSRHAQLDQRYGIYDTASCTVSSCHGEQRRNFHFLCLLMSHVAHKIEDSSFPVDAFSFYRAGRIWETADLTLKFSIQSCMYGRMGEQTVLRLRTTDPRMYLGQGVLNNLCSRSSLVEDQSHKSAVSWSVLCPYFCNSIGQHSRNLMTCSPVSVS